MSANPINYDDMAKQAGALQPPSAPTDQYDAIAQQAGAINVKQPTPVQQPTGISRLWTPDNPDPNAPPPDNMQQLKDAAVGAGKSLLKGAGVVGDIATLGLTHLLPNSDKASAGINAPGTALNPTNDDQKHGGYVGDLANFELGSGIMESLSHLPLAERMIQAAKALKVAQEHPVIAAVASNAIKGAAQGGAGTLVATGNPKIAAEGAAVGGIVAPAAEVVGKAAKAVGKGVQYVRDIYRDLPTADAVQPVLQNAIKDVAAKVADDAGVEAGDSPSIRDTIADVADNIKAKAQPTFQKIDELSNGEFSDAQAAADKYRGSIDKAGKDAYSDAIQKQNDIFDSVKDHMDPDALTQAKADWRRMNALSDVADAIQKSTSGTRPEIAALSKAAQPTEAINPKQLSGKLNTLYNEGTLQTALGDQAHALLDHTGAAQQRLVTINDALTAQKSKQRAVAYVGKRAAIGTLSTGVGVPAAAEGLKLIGVLGKK